MKIKSKSMIILCILNVCNSCFIIFEAFCTKILIDKACDKESVTIPIILLIAVVAAQIVTRIIYKHTKNKENVRIEADLKQDIFNSLLEKKVPSLDSIHTGELSNLYLVDIKNIATAKTETIPEIYSNVSKALLSFIALAIFDYKFLIILVLFGIVLYIIAKTFYPRIKGLQKSSLEEDGKTNAFMQETIENIKVVKALNSTKNAKQKLKQKVEKTKKIKNKKNVIMEIGENGISVAMNLSYLAAIFYSVFSIIKGKMSYGDLFAFTQLVVVFETPLMAFAGYINKINIYKTSEERINCLYKLEEEIIEQDISDFDEIIFQDVSFSYDKEVISHFNQVIKKDELVLFKGPSGAGKTTLFYLLLGFIKPTEGHVYIKYNDDFYEAGPNTRGLFTYVSQQNILFSGSLFDNIRFFNPNATDKEIIEVLESVNLINELESRGESINIHLNEHGNGLSVGQIQRVLIAISLLQHKPCMLLDEFSSALDEQNEEDIVNLLLQLNKTIIFISHRSLDSKDIRRIEI